MKLSRTVGYAVQAMVQLAVTEDDRPISCRRLAEAGGMPERFLLQILRSLVTNGLLHSTRGVEGGYRLSRDPDEISLLDIVESIDGPLRLELPQEWENHAVRFSLAECGQRVRSELDMLKLSMLADGDSSRLTLDPIDALDPRLVPTSAGESACNPRPLAESVSSAVY